MDVPLVVVPPFGYACTIVSPIVDHAESIITGFPKLCEKLPLPVVVSVNESMPNEFVLNDLHSLKSVFDIVRT